MDRVRGLLQALIMNKSDYLQLISKHARPLGYARASTLFWKTGREHTSVIQVQKSRWCDGVYINIGATPNTFIRSVKIPRVKYWGITMRADSWDSPFVDDFRRCETDSINSILPEEMDGAVRWLVQHVEDNVQNEANFRDLILNPRSVEHSHASLMMKDWAMGKLKSPEYYA